MKKLLTAIFALTILGVVLNSCKKDEETVYDNSITIEGTFNVGNKTFTNPTFDLGKPEMHIGYLYFFAQKAEPDGYVSISTPKGEDIDLGEGNYLYYRLRTYITVVGETQETSLRISIYNDEEGYFDFYSSTLKTKITKIEEVDGFIEGTYEGSLTDNSGLNKKVVEYPVKGKFKVKRIDINSK